MRVAVLVGAGRVEVTERPAPRPGPGEVIVDVTSVGVCGSDVASYELAVDVPRVLGHEAAGVVRALGEGVPGLHLGQRVSIEPVLPDLAVLGRVTARVLVLGCAGDDVHPVRVAERLAAAIPGAELHIYHRPSVLWTNRSDLRGRISTFLNAESP